MKDITPSVQKPHSAGAILMPMLIGSYPQFSHSHSLKLGLAVSIAMTAVASRL